MKKKKTAKLIYDFKKNTNVETINIGDYVQTLAALELVGEKYQDLDSINREDYRNKLKQFDKRTEYKFIANGWYAHNDKAFLLEKNLNPLFVSVHLIPSQKLNLKEIKILKKFEPIGCRDLDTVDKLNSYDIKAYFSGCLTLAMKERKQKRKGIVFIVDNIWISGKRIKSFEEFMKWDFSKIVIDELLNEFTYDEIKSAKFFDQFSELDYSIEKQFEIAEKRLDDLSKFDLVVTTRIHTLMPSMAMGSRTLFIMLDNTDARFKGLNQFWNYIDFTNKNNIIKKINKNKKNKIINDESFREFMIPTIEKVKEYWNN